MKNNEKTWIYGIAGFFAGIVITYLLASSAVNSKNIGMMQMMGMRSSNQNMMANTNAIDAHFIEQMIPHHEDAITMSKLAQTKATKPEVKQLAENIISSQQTEIDQMKDWYKKWYGKDVPAGDNTMSAHNMMGGKDMHMGMMGNETDMERLENADDFDRAFVEQMIPHHQMAVMMANMLEHGTNRPEMEKLAKDIISAQTKEINDMRQWYRDWGY